jgi:predicted SnoaL-like aldol condensation-catalyzing enzyme
MDDDIKKTVFTQPHKRIQLAAADELTIIRQGAFHVKTRFMKNRVKPHIQKLKGNRYRILSTGEEKEMAATTGKTNHNLKHTYEALRGLIRANFTNDAHNQVFLTLTYRENIRDAEKVCNDFRAFFQRLRRTKPEHQLEYISVIEPQARGAWHLHVMIKSDQPVLWFDKWKIKEVWGKERGNAYVERLKSDDVGAYYVSYFTHLFLDENQKKGVSDIDSAMAEVERLKTAQKEHEQGHNPDAPADERMALLKKARIKGGRLHFYPRDLKFYRCSSGIIRPKKEEIFQIDLENMNLGEPAYSTTREILDETGKQLNVIQTDYYNLHRKRRIKRKLSTKRPKKAEKPPK